jgi:hypothetical protein
LFSLHGIGFGEGNSPSNEQGLYLGCNVVPHKKIQVSIFLDQFWTLDPSPMSYFPVHGTDFFIFVRTSLFRHHTLSVQYQTKENGKPLNSSAEDVLLSWDYSGKQSWRIDWRHTVSQYTKVGCRIEYLIMHYRVTGKDERGILLYSDLSVKPSNRCNCNLRLIVFHVDSYAARISEYERNYNGAMTVPSLYGNGVRWYFLCMYDLSDHLKIGVKYSNLIRDDVKHLGSGYGELPANYDNRFGVQIDMNF